MTSDDPAAADADLRAEVDRLRRERDAARAEAEALARRLAEVEQIADRDPLTPVLNRRAFVRELARMAAFCARYGGPASLLYFDLDGFKAINDRFGHAAGDAVLETVAQALLDHVRESDAVARLGGDEFAVLLARTGGEAAVTKGRSLVEALERDAVVTQGRAIAVRVSVGVRDWEAGLDPTRWLAEADAAMYLNKGVRRP